MNSLAVKNIFVAVSQKQILDPMLSVLDPKSVRFWGTEGTVKYLASKGFIAKSVVAGFDFDGRVKSLNRETFIRILADRGRSLHVKELKKLKIEPFDLVIVDLYPLDRKKFPESMDIGGQSLIRAAVKNYKNVAIVFDRGSMDMMVGHLKTNRGAILLSFRKKQAKSAADFIAKRCMLEAKWFK